MVAEYLSPTPAALPLVLPPDQPTEHVYRTFGWRWKPNGDFNVLERRPQDDAQGAVVQWIVLRYYRDGMLRKALAAEYGYSERRIQEYLSGKKRRSDLAGWFVAYSAPVLRALTRLGIPNADTRCNKRKRLEPQIAACRAAIADLAYLLTDDPRPEARRLLRDVELLTVGAGHDG